jgi:hypothetical protein
MLSAAINQSGKGGLRSAALTDKGDRPLACDPEADLSEQVDGHAKQRAPPADGYFGIGAATATCNCCRAQRERLASEIVRGRDLEHFFNGGDALRHLHGA